MARAATKTLETASVEETLALGCRLGGALQPGDTIALIGTLGSGKTHFVKGVARGVDVPAEIVVNSPTFVPVNEYPGRLHLYHLDAYRLSGAEELEALGFEEMASHNSAVLVEWADRVHECLPEDHLRIEIEIVGDTARQFTIAAKGSQSTALLKTL